MTDEQAPRSTFSAADAALGYLYQTRLALLSALRRARAGKEFTLRLETLDDVVFETSGAPLDLLQTKHHRERSANLGDASADIWKTLRVWSEGIRGNRIPPDASLYLVTTSTAAEGSVASYLRTTPRDPESALKRLRAAAQSSSSQSNAPAYAAFLTLGDDKQHQMVENVYVLDASPGVADLEGELRREVRWAVERNHRDPFLHRLEGWWLRRAIQHLSDRNAQPILSEEFEGQIDDLRTQFKRDALPIDEDILAVEVDASAYNDAVFVQQLRLAGVGAQRVVAAIREYFRAFEQRSRWAREELLLVGELGRYERRLVEEWELVFARARDELGDPTAEDLKQQAAAAVYRWIEETVIPIRPNVTEPFVTRGSYHLLADRLRVGWHPEFMDRLRHLLEGQS